MKIAIMGAANLVGQRISAAMHKAGNAPPGVLHPALDAGTAAALLKDCTAVLNCTLGKPADILAAATRLHEWLGALPAPPRLVHLSYMTVYGSAEGLASETSPLLDDLSPYAAAQIAAEQLAARMAGSVTLRPGVEYGPGVWPWSGRVARWLRARRIGGLGQTGDGTCNLLYIDDLITAILHALQAPGVEGQAFNLGCAAPPSWNGYFEQFAEALGAGPMRSITAQRLTIETRLLAPPLKIMELLASRSGEPPRWLPPAIPPSLPALCRQKLRLDVRAAEGQLGMQWTDLAQGLQQTAAALRP